MSRARNPDPTVLQSAIDGFSGKPFSGLFTSTMHAAHCIGAHMRSTGRSMPRDVRPGRGDAMHCNDMLFRLNWRSSVEFPTITREG